VTCPPLRIDRGSSLSRMCAPVVPHARGPLIRVALHDLRNSENGKAMSSNTGTATTASGSRCRRAHSRGRDDVCHAAEVPGSGLVKYVASGTATRPMTSSARDRSRPMTNSRRWRTNGRRTSQKNASIPVTLMPRGISLRRIRSSYRRRACWVPPQTWRQFKIDPAKANGSSIAVLAEYANKSALLLGDVHPDVVCASIRRLCAESAACAA
jgi:hypothetical protein